MHFLLKPKEFILKTDQRSIVDKFRRNTSATSLRQQQYSDYIAQITSKVQHVASVSNVADSLSRPLEHFESDLNAILPEESSLDYLLLIFRGETPRLKAYARVNQLMILH